MYLRCTMALIIAAATTVSAESMTVTLDPSVRKQTVTGFGATNTIAPWKERQGAFYVDVDLQQVGFYDKIINELGLTVLRHEVPPQFEPSNDNGDADSFNWSGFDTTLLRSHVTRFLEAREVAEANGEPLHFIAMVASPPAWMKANNSETRRSGEPDNDRAENRLLPEYYDEFAEFCLAYVEALRWSYGIEVAALSPVNEPTNSLLWTSCVYSPEEVHDVVAVVAGRVAASGNSTKVMFPEEDVGGVETLGRYVNAVVDDPAVRQHVSVVGIHAYELAWLKPAVAPLDSAEWATVYGWGGQFGLPLWITEAPHFENSWRGSFALGRFLLHALRNGRASLWSFYGLMGDTVLEKNLMVRDSGHSHYDISRHFYRFIRPGASQIGSSSSVDSVEIVAFADPNGVLTVQLVNIASTGYEVTVSGQSMPDSFDVYTSVEGDLCKQTGTLLSTHLPSIPPRSLVTLVGRGYDPAGVRPAGRDIRDLRRTESVQELYRLDGRRAASAVAPSVAISVATSVATKPCALTPVAQAVRHATCATSASRRPNP